MHLNLGSAKPVGNLLRVKKFDAAPHISSPTEWKLKKKSHPEEKSPVHAWHVRAPASLPIKKWRKALRCAVHTRLDRST